MIERARHRVGLGSETELGQAWQEPLEMLAAEVAKYVFTRGFGTAP